MVHEPRRGYGNAYLAGLGAANGRYIVMLDADLTYDIGELPRFINALEEGGDLVLGDRLQRIHPGAMPWLHRYVGNPLLTGLLNRLFGAGVRDAHCGMRAIRREALPQLDLRTSGMEFASEMVIRAAKQELDIRQFPIEYHPRAGESKLSTFRDGWRHLRFLLVHSPKHLFLFPGAVMSGLGVLVMAVVLSEVSVFGRVWDIHAMIGGALLLLVGVQVMSLGLCAHAYGAYFMDERDDWFDRHAGALPARARAAVGRWDRPDRRRAGRRPVRDLGRPRLRRAVRGVAGGVGRDPVHRRGSGLLHLVPDQHSGPAQTRVAGVSVRWALAAGIALIVAALGAFLLIPDERVVGTNTVAPLNPVRSLHTGKRACQELPRVPENAGVARLRAETDSGRPSFRLRILDRRGAIAAGEASERPNGRIDVELSPATRSSGEARICVTNTSDERLRLFGEQKRPYKGAPIRLWAERYAVAFLAERSSSWASRAGVIADRFRLGHAGAVGTWGLWLALLLAAGAAVLAIWQLARDLARR